MLRGQHNLQACSVAHVGSQQQVQEGGFGVVWPSALSMECLITAKVQDGSWSSPPVRHRMTGHAAFLGVVCAVAEETCRKWAGSPTQQMLRDLILLCISRALSCNHSPAEVLCQEVGKSLVQQCVLSWGTVLSEVTLDSSASEMHWISELLQVLWHAPGMRGCTLCHA